MTEEFWQKLYFNLVNETGGARLAQEIAETESALQERLQEIDPSQDPEEYSLLRRTIESVIRLKSGNLANKFLTSRK